MEIVRGRQTDVVSAHKYILLLFSIDNYLAGCELAIQTHIAYIRQLGREDIKEDLQTTEGIRRVQMMLKSARVKAFLGQMRHLQWNLEALEKLEQVHRAIKDKHLIQALISILDFGLLPRDDPQVVEFRAIFSEFDETRKWITFESIKLVLSIVKRLRKRENLENIRIDHSRSAEDLCREVSNLFYDIREQIKRSRASERFVDSMEYIEQELKSMAL
eukprot:TRINITY_DN2206_c0_g1_i7.p1 TRINITY_DN2206_c0_g1~~TRINITY_DN2206_c0_g1_i7.p1  ORF type:complete len:217 (+),score=37.05 TRINITY_DN2206_c0_g1_i7:64-714(+)